MKKVSFIILLLLVAFPVQISLAELKENSLSIEKEKIILMDSKKKNIADIFRVTKFEEIKDYCSIERNGQTNYLFLIIGKNSETRGNRVVLLSLMKGKLENIWEGLKEKYNPWKILTQDVDGDGKLEICIGVWKKARFHPVFDNRLFVFGFEDGQIFPKWLGSRLSSPMLDFGFADVDQDGLCELISLELQRNGRHRIISYKWTGFGFEGFKILAEDILENKLDENRFCKK